MAKAAEKKEELVEVVVDSENHSHEGKLCKRGEKIMVDQRVADMLGREWAKEAKQEKK